MFWTYYILVLNFIQIYNENEILQAKLDILNKTNMMDYVIEIYKQLNPDKEVPEVSTFLIFIHMYNKDV